MTNKLAKHTFTCWVSRPWQCAPRSSRHSGGGGGYCTAGISRQSLSCSGSQCGLWGTQAEVSVLGSPAPVAPCTPIPSGDDMTPSAIQAPGFRVVGPHGVHQQHMVAIILLLFPGTPVVRGGAVGADVGRPCWYCINSCFHRLS